MTKLKKIILGYVAVIGIALIITAVTAKQALHAFVPAKAVNVNNAATRNTMATVIQHNFWRKGIDAKIFSEVTHPNGKNALFVSVPGAGAAYAYNFQLDFVNPSAHSLIEAGFQKVVLNNAGDAWQGTLTSWPFELVEPDTVIPGAPETL